MTAVKRWIVRLFERLTNRWYEGPNPPKRIEDFAQVFANEHPFATVQDWKRFSEGLAAEFYRSGFTRGWEWNERGSEPWPAVDPDVIADHLFPDWRWSQPVRVTSDMATVPKEEIPE